MHSSGVISVEGRDGANLTFSLITFSASFGRSQRRQNSIQQAQHSRCNYFTQCCHGTEIQYPMLSVLFLFCWSLTVSFLAVVLEHWRNRSPSMVCLCDRMLSLWSACRLQRWWKIAALCIWRIRDQGWEDRQRNWKPWSKEAEHFCV